VWSKDLLLLWAILLEDVLKSFITMILFFGFRIVTGLIYCITPEISVNGEYQLRIRNYQPQHSAKGNSLESGINMRGAENALRPK